MAPQDLEEILNSVPQSRRDFLKKALMGAAFAAPVVASFNMAEASHVELGLPFGHCDANTAVCGPPFYEPVIEPALPGGTSTCCAEASKVLRDINVHLLLATEVEADLIPAPAASRARLSRRLAAALRLVSRGIEVGGLNCNSNKKLYRMARTKIREYKDLLVTLSLNVGTLSANADEVLASLEEIIDGTC